MGTKTSADFLTSFELCVKAGLARRDGPFPDEVFRILRPSSVTALDGYLGVLRCVDAFLTAGVPYAVPTQQCSSVRSHLSDRCAYGGYHDCVASLLVGESRRDPTIVVAASLVTDWLLHLVTPSRQDKGVPTSPNIDEVLFHTPHCLEVLAGVAALNTGRERAWLIVDLLQQTSFTPEQILEAATGFRFVTR
ncbi:MAG: hypothetical protein AAB384_02580 [Patescibacteria group bacterium]